MLFIETAQGRRSATSTNFDPRIKVVFLPLNTSSLLQLMDHAAIKTLKTGSEKTCVHFFHHWNLDSAPEPDEIANEI